ncbi:MAG: class I SAM-dependent methyltransferase [Actinomycetota bacterium]|nr:class I SAM-dependent methyltransferase [Actinomycetota bacterium]
MPDAPSDARSVFNSHADHYEESRNRLIPPFEDFYGTAVTAVAHAGDVKRVLDLGAGTGMLAGFVREAYPGAHVTLFDGAPAMLEKAKANLGEDRVTYVEGDLYGELPEGPWDAVVSALAVHHLTDEGKRHIYQSAFDLLRPGGVFVNSEHVSAPAPQLDEVYNHSHECRARENGINDLEWEQAVERMKADHLTALDPQLEWLRESGFEEVDCLFKDHGFAVIFARKPG